MRRSASEIIRDLERRIARLENKTQKQASTFKYVGNSFYYTIPKRFFLEGINARNIVGKPVLLELWEAGDIGLGLFDVNNGEEYIIAAILADEYDGDDDHEHIDDGYSDDKREAYKLFKKELKSNWNGSMKSTFIGQ